MHCGPGVAIFVTSRIYRYEHHCHAHSWSVLLLLYIIIDCCSYCNYFCYVFFELLFSSLRYEHYCNAHSWPVCLLLYIYYCCLWLFIFIIVIVCVMTNAFSFSFFCFFFFFVWYVYRPFADLTAVLAFLRTKVGLVRFLCISMERSPRDLVQAMERKLQQ